MINLDRAGYLEYLEQCRKSGQMSAGEIEAHIANGELPGNAQQVTEITDAQIDAAIYEIDAVMNDVDFVADDYAPPFTPHTLSQLRVVMRKFLLGAK